jgi:hypothetical protein
MDYAIENLGEEIRQPSNPYAKPFSKGLTKVSSECSKGHDSKFLAISTSTSSWWS